MLCIPWDTDPYQIFSQTNNPKRSVPHSPRPQTYTDFRASSQSTACLRGNRQLPAASIDFRQTPTASLKFAGNTHRHSSHKNRHVDYYDSWDEELEVALHSALVKSQSNFMLSTWHHNDYRSNEYIEQVWNDCQIITREHFYHVGAKEKNRNPVIEALLTNYVITGTQNQLRLENEQLSLFSTSDTLPEKIAN